MNNSDNAQIIDFLSCQSYPQGTILLLSDIRPDVEKQFQSTIKDPYHALREAFNYLKRKSYIKKTSIRPDGEYEVLRASQTW